jgi:hypothetical protein
MEVKNGSSIIILVVYCNNNHNFYIHGVNMVIQLLNLLLVQIKYFIYHFKTYTGGKKL